jgi:hypothetical protein
LVPSTCKHRKGAKPVNIKLFLLTLLLYRVEMKRTYYPNYFSLEDIFVTAEKIPCEVEQNLQKLGFLDPSSDSPDLKAGTSLELPLWYILQVQKERSRTQFYK